MFIRTAMRSYGFAGFAILVGLIGAVLAMSVTAAAFALLHTPGHSSYNGGVVGIIGIVFAIVGLAIATFAILYSSGPPRYTLNPESLTIQDRFYLVTLSATSVDIPHIRVVDLGVDTDWRPTMRMGGFSNPHYRSGRFRLASGKIIHMYQADGGRLVLLPPKSDGTAVLVETRNPKHSLKKCVGSGTGIHEVE